MLAQTYAFQFKMPVMVARSCNIYGPGDTNFTRLIPRSIMRLLAGKAPVINSGNDRVLREYIYVKDEVDAYLLLAEKSDDYYGPENSKMPKSGRIAYGWPAFNIGSYNKKEIKKPAQCDKIKSVTDVISILRKKIADIKPIIIGRPPQFIEIPDQYADSSKIRGLGFTAKFSFDEGIDESIKWYQKNATILAKNAFKYIHG